ncbi:YraN family protein [Hymenobacter koreensis]
MPTSAHLGATGEQAAADFLTTQGYTVVARNYRHGRAEIDLIAQQGGKRLVFVEVKVRSDLRYGFPEQSVTLAQQQRVRRAAEHYLLSTNWLADIRFDILALTPTTGGFRVEHFEDAF